MDWNHITCSMMIGQCNKFKNLFKKDLMINHAKLSKIKPVESLSPVIPFFVGKAAAQ